MKKIITALFLIAINLVNAQAFKGKGDDKFSVGANFQDGASGIQVSYDLGMGPNISLGFTGGYLMGIDENPLYSPEFTDKIDFKARFNAHLCDVIGVKQLDVYPGLNIGLRNFGGHIGARYFFSDGFGIFTEGVFPIAKYDKNTDELQYQHLNNQFTFNIGAVFSMN
ncbi:MAG: DUF6646 family protein [Flavobacterium sp.]